MKNNDIFFLIPFFVCGVLLGTAALALAIGYLFVATLSSAGAFVAGYIANAFWPGLASYE